MNIFEFMQLDFEGRGQATSAYGKLIAQRSSSTCLYLLYSLNDFFVEVTCDFFSHESCDITAFSNTAQLEPYLDEMDLEI